MKKKLLIVVFLLTFVFLGIGFSYYTFNKQVPTTEIRDSLFSLYLKNTSETFVENTGWYETKIDYPKDNQKVRDQIFQEWNNFTKENQLKDFTDEKSAREALGIVDSEIRYTFDAQYKMVNSTNTISYVYQIYTYTGGAHGATDIFPITYNDKLEVIPVEKILPDSSLEKVSKICFEEILKQKKEKLKEFDIKDTSWVKEGTDPTRDNYSRAWVEGDNIVISFGQYQVGPYVEGMYEVRVPMSSF